MSDTIVDRYELRGTLGTGGMARVMDGYDRLLDRRVAVKLLRSDLRGDPAVRRRFVREARAAASFAHPHAVAVYDTGQDDTVPYIVMELVEGPTLADVIAERGPLPVDEACTIACDVLDALAAAHRRGLVHRDVKPSNVLLEPADGGFGRAKLTDFGIAKGAREATAALTALGQVMGTAAYLSPEQARGEDATARSDLYSMGVVLYEMLAGRPPFTGEHALVVVLAHRDDAPPRLDRLRKGLPRELTTTVHRSLEKDPARRFDSATAMRDALRPFAGAGAGTVLPPALAAADAAQPADAADVATVPYEPLASTRTGGAAADEGTAAPAAPSRRGRRVWLVAAAFVALALLAVVGVAALTGGEDAPEGGAPETAAPGSAVEPSDGDTTDDAATADGDAPTGDPTSDTTGDSPSGDTTGDTTDEPAVTEEPTSEETAAPTEEPTVPEETAAPTEEPTVPEETAAPTEEPTVPEETAAPTEEPTVPEETAPPTDSGS